MSLRGWWQWRSVKLRLSLFYAAASTFVLVAFTVFVYELVEHRLAAQVDRQLRIDFDVTEAQLGLDESGKLQWAVRGAHGDEGFARLSAWFEVWTEDGRLLLRHWPIPEAEIERPLPPPQTGGLRFYTAELEPEIFARVMERPARVHTLPVVLRLIRDESDYRTMLRQIVEVSILGLPVTVLLLSLGGYLIARRALAPVAGMAEQARRITSESLSARLPNPNPTDELGRLATVFNDTLQRLESSFAELKRFTADASHELRTPLTALQATGEVGLRQQTEVQELRETISSMLEEAARLRDLIESLLLLARMESDTMSAERVPVRIADCVREVVDSLAVLAVERRQQLDASGDEEMCAKVEVFKDVEHVARSSQHLALIALSKVSLPEIIDQAQRRQAGTVFSIMPQLRDRKAVLEVLIADANGKVAELGFDALSGAFIVRRERQ